MPQAAQDGEPESQQPGELDRPRSSGAFPKPDVSIGARPLNQSREARKRQESAPPAVPLQTATPISLGAHAAGMATPAEQVASPLAISLKSALATPLSVKLGFDVKAVEAMIPRTPSDFSDREARMPCSFPGLLRILIPEKSFTPYTLAVRVANISVTGAMVEIHDRSKLPPDLAMANRFFELKVAHGEIPHMRGIVVWSDLNRANPMLGVSCFEQFTELGKVFKQEGELNGAVKLSPPKLDPYPPKTKEAVLKLSGEAPPEAEAVVAKGDNKKFRGAVENGRFTVEIELEPNRENHFSVRAQMGVNKSRAIPVRIFREQSTVAFRCDVQMTDCSTGGKKVMMDFNGNVRQAELMLFRMSQLLANAERVSLMAKLESQTGFDLGLYDALQQDAKVLMESDESSAQNQLPTPEGGASHLLERELEE
ncbi:hypothetical protein IT570_00105 [Candidatus Sumerlaeota bacterium]|nr:hypothetical protein [Candidatus Sumerlaeota bacterium]